MRDEKVEISEGSDQAVFSSTEHPSSSATSRGSNSTRSRSSSVILADKTVSQRQNSLTKLNHRNIWLMNRSHFKLSDSQVRILKEFHGLLKSAITDLFTAIKVISSGKVSPDASLLHQVVAVPLRFIPYAGPIIADGYQAIIRKQVRSSYQNFSRHLSSFNDMDVITEEFSAIITSYYQAEILEPSNNFTVFESVKRFITTPRISEALKRFVAKRVEKYITGTDDKDKVVDNGYKSHWVSLIENVLIQLLANLNDLTFDDSDNRLVACKLSSSLTPSSNAPLGFNISEQEPLDYGNVNTLARLSLLAYDTQRKIEELANLWGYRKDRSVKSYYFTFDRDIQGFVLADADKVIVSFRGTATTANIFSDANMYPSKLLKTSDEKVAKVHSGFNNATKRIWPKIKEFILGYLSQFPSNTRQPQIWFTGHSLGGAIAVIAAYNCAYSEERLLNESCIHLCTFGQPKVGNEVFVQMLEARVSDYQRFVNYLDIVPLVPAPYVHGGQLRWLNARGKLHDISAYTEVMEQLDQYGKKVVRSNTINILLHTGNHSMSGYVGKLGALLSRDCAVHVLSFYEYNCYEHKARFSANLAADTFACQLLIDSSSKSNSAAATSSSKDNESDRISRDELQDLERFVDSVIRVVWRADDNNDEVEVIPRHTEGSRFAAAGSPNLFARRERARRWFGGWYKAAVDPCGNAENAQLPGSNPSSLSTAIVTLPFTLPFVIAAFVITTPVHIWMLTASTMELNHDEEDSIPSPR